MIDKPRYHQYYRIVFSCCLLFVLWSCNRSSGPTYPQAPVIIITVDTLRSDRLPAYGYGKIKTPAIDAFASDAVVFDKAYAHSPITLPSHATIMTGKLPQNHGVRENVGFILSDSATTLAEKLKEAQYDTGGFVSSMVLRPDTGVDQGFDTYKGPFRNNPQQTVRTFSQQSGKDTLDQALEWVKNKEDGSFFLWVHLYEPHTPYEPPAPYDRYSDPYDGEIAYTDSLLGNFFANLKSQNLYDKSLVILASDHGESLGEHGEKEHKLFVYRPVVQVPLMVKHPQSEQAGTRSDLPVGLVDIFPTVLDLLKIKKTANDGISLFGKKKSSPKRLIYSEAMTPELQFGWHAHRGIIKDDHHYLQSDKPEVFNLQNDINELKNLAKSTPFPKDVRKALIRKDGDRLVQTEVSDEDQEMLASLGYSGGFNMGGEILELSKEQFLDLYYKLDHVMALLDGEKYEDAEAILVPMLQAYPSVFEARVLLGLALRKQEKLDQAAHLFMEGIALYPDDVVMLKGLALTLMKQGSMDQVEQLALKAANINPSELTPDLIPSLFDKEQFDLVLKLVDKVLEVNPNYAFGIFAKGRAANAQKRFPEAVEHLTHAIEVAQNTDNQDTYQRAFFWLGDTYARQGKFPSARNLFTQLLREDPNHSGARASLSMVYASVQEPRKAIQVLDEWVSAFPTEENFIKAAETMEQIGLTKPAAFYRDAAEKVRLDHEKQPSQ